jgi:hypothetical protein
MRSRSRRVALVFIPLLAALALPAAAQELRLDTTGFYPVWENTGHVERSGDFRLGTTGTQFGIADVAHVGLQPINFIYRSPNAYAKVEVFHDARWSVAAQAGAYRLMSGAARAFFSPMYSTRLDNPDFGITLAPISLSGSYEAARWLEIHQTITALGVYSNGSVQSGVTGGYSVVAELNPHGRHGLSFHAADAGILTRDLTLAGASYRYRNSWMELRCGYFYRATSTGVQATPLVALGVLL